jgi:DNA-binding transcriptional LysR family regulator
MLRERDRRDEAFGWQAGMPLHFRADIEADRNPVGRRQPVACDEGGCRLFVWRVVERLGERHPLLVGHLEALDHVSRLDDGRFAIPVRERSGKQLIERSIRVLPLEPGQMQG